LRQIDMTNPTRTCADCSTDISDRHGNATRCKPCNRLKRIKSVPRASCAECDGSMVGKRADAAYCSLPCAGAAAYRRRNPGVARAKDRSCEDCGVGIADRHPKAKLCADCSRCRDNGTGGPRARQYVRLNRTCETCGEEFIAKRVTSRCCSRKCTRAKINAVHNAAKYVVLEPKDCRGCGQQFMPQRSDGNWCSGSCYQRHTRPYVPVENPPKPCALCGELFEPVRSDALFCSRRCLHKLHTQLRRARKLSNRDNAAVYPQDWLGMLRRHCGRCAYCDRRTDRLTMDHVIPISRGGRHAIGNLMPICKHCNSSKGPKLLSEWRYRYGGRVGGR
jgi:5-methylcytosine-specific restriction endonuclease McrA